MKHVYFIKPVGMDGPVKIGCSASPTGRRDTLDNWSPFALEIVAEIEGGFELEGRFHALFKGSHQRREWFNPSPRMDDVIAAINAGTFDTDSLPPFMGIGAIAGREKAKRTPEQRADHGYSLRLTHMQRRSGYRFRANNYRMVARDDRLMIDFAEAYLRDPARHGDLINAQWAYEAARRFQHLTPSARTPKQVTA